MDRLRESIESSGNFSESQLNELNQTLNNNTAQEVLNETPIEVIVQTVRNLYVDQHSLGILYLLNRQIKSIVETKEDTLSQFTSTASTNPAAIEFWTQTAKFLQGFHLHQVQVASTQFAILCRAFTNVSIALHKSISGIYPLCQALKKLSSDSALTPLHYCIILLSVRAKMYALSVPMLLENPIYKVNPASGITATDVIKYFYYGGVALVGMEKFIEAKEFFLMVMLVPSKTLSKILVEACKKYLCLSVIVFRTPTTSCLKLPRSIPAMLQRPLASECASYLELLSDTSSSKSLIAKLVNATTELQNDGNYGLFCRVVEAVRVNRITQLTTAFVTISLVDIAVHAELEDEHEAEAYVVKLVQKGIINATIDRESKFVTFHVLDKSPVDVQSAVEAVVAVSDYLRTVDAQFASDPRYVENCSNASNGSGTTRRSSVSNWKQAEFAAEMGGGTSSSSATDNPSMAI